MNLKTMIEDLIAKAANLESDAKAIREAATNTHQLLFGGAHLTSGADEGGSNSGTVASTPAASKPKGGNGAQSMPSVNEIRDKAAEFGVDVSDLLPAGKKPTIKQKNDAMTRILNEKKAQKAQQKKDKDKEAAQAGVTTTLIS